MKRNGLQILLSLLVIGEAVLLVGFIAIQRWKAAGVSAVERGKQVADHYGCFACHGPGGDQGIPNPGSDEGEVPAWSGGTAMMYVMSEEEIREWILDGSPRRLRAEHEDGGGEHDDHGEKGGHLIHMPAYRGVIQDAELEDLVAYYKAVAWFDEPEDEQVVRGRDTAWELGCFGCHGPSGRGTVSNPGAFKGYIPGWDGDDFKELAPTDDEISQWVRYGISDRFKQNMAARHFIDRAPLKMPAYGDLVSDQQLADITAYIHWLQEHPQKRSANQ